MDRIQHSYIDVRGEKLHVAEIGTGSSVVVFLHGFPEIWYSWRHQMLAVAGAGYRAIAPDLRGYGASEPHPDPEKASFDDFVEDTLAILDSLHVHKAFLIGKDFGSWVVYLISLFHPERVAGVVSLGVPFFVPKPQGYQELAEGFYIFRWKDSRRTEEDFGRLDVKTVWKNIYILFSRSEIPVAEKGKEIMDLVDPSTSLPPWLSNEDVTAYATSYEKSGFNSPMLVPYRKGANELTIKDPKVEVPVLLLVGMKDYFLKFPGKEEYITRGEVKEYVPDIEIEYLPEGSHFMQEQFSEKVNQLISSFLGRHV